MSVKNSIRLIEYSSVFILCAFLLMVLALVGNTEGQSMHVNFYLLGASGILFFIYLFRDKIIYSRLKHSKHRNLFYRVLDKMHLSENILFDKEEVLKAEAADDTKEIDAFMRENALNPCVRTRKIHDFYIWGAMVGCLVVVYLLHNLLMWSPTDTIMVAVLCLMGIVFIYLFSNLNFFRSGGIAMEFSKEGLMIQEQAIAWDKIIDWQYNRRDLSKSATITIYYYNTYLEVQTVRIELDQLSIRKIDLVLLLSHFKDTYGRTIY